MKYFFFLFILLVTSLNGYASHILGGDIYYEQLSQNQYRVFVKLYRDCNGVAAPGAVTIGVAKLLEANNFSTFQLGKVSQSIVPNLCTMVSNRCGSNGNYGIEEHVYSGVYNLPQALSNENIEFRYSDCCKSGAINNLTNAVNLNTYLRVSVYRPPVSPTNTGPVFLTDPVYFTPTSANQVNTYSHLAYDADGDSLVYRLENVQLGHNNFATYAGGYSAANPFGNGITSTIDPETGLLTITGVTNQRCCTYVVAVDEYRNGVLLSTTRREVSLLFKPPSSSPQEISDFAGQSGSHLFFHCQAGILRDTLIVRDLDASDNVIISVVSSSPFITIQPVVPGNPVSVVLEVDMTNIGMGEYSFTINSNDNGCPFPLTNNRTFMISIIDTIPPVPTVDTLFAECSVTVPMALATDNCRSSVTGTTNDPLTFNALGTYAVNWLFDDRNGNTATARQVVVVRDITPPVVPALPDVVAQCEATVTPPIAEDNCMGQIIGTTSDPLTYSTQGTYVITWNFEDGNGNRSSGTQRVIIDDTIAPVAPTLAVIRNCGQATAPTPTAVDNCVGTVTGTTTDPLTYSSPGIYTVVWSFNDGNGNVSTANQVVTVVEIPAVLPIPTVHVCNGTPKSVTFDATVASTYTWTNSNTAIGLVASGTGNIPSFTARNTTNAPISATITVTPTSNGCVGEPYSFEIVVAPDVKLRGTVDMPSVCRLTTEPTIQLNLAHGAAPYTISYTIDGGTTQTVQSVGSVAEITVPTDRAGVFAYRFLSVQSGDSLACTTAIDTTIRVTIFELPTIFAGNDSIVCPDARYVFRSSGTAVTYVWNTNARNGDWTTITAPTEFVVTGTDANGCVNRDTVFIDLFIPSIVYAGEDQVICFKEEVTLSAQFTDGVIGTYNWNFGVNDGVPFRPTNSNMYTVIGLDANGCKSTDSVYVTVNSLPVIVLDNLKRGCEGDQILLNASGVTNGSYVWSNGVMNQSTFEAPVGRNWYTVEVTDGNGCKSKDSVEVFIQKYLDIDFVVKQDGYCYPVEVELTNTSPEIGTNCVWTVDGLQPVNGCSRQVVTINEPGVFGVNLRMQTIENGCVSQRRMDSLIVIDKYPIAKFKFTPEKLTEIYSVAEFINQSTLAETYYWDFGNERHSSLENPSMDYGPDVRRYLATLYAYSLHGCLDTTAMIVQVGEELIFYIPNTFTPDGNRYNEIFKPVFTSGYDPQNYVLYIYNRWGEQIFESHDAEVGWNGRYGEMGDICPDGSYSWVIEVATKDDAFGTGKSRFNGHITLLR